MSRGRLSLIGLLLAAATLAVAPGAAAHQGVELLPSDRTPARGPLLVDGTVSFAVRADVSRGDTRGFRLRLQRGQTLAVQLLIVDEPPANQVAPAALPRVVVTDPRGRATVMPINERTEFYEPYGRTTYLYLSRLKRTAVPGTYQVQVTGRSAQPVEAVIAVGYREVPGEVRR